MRSAICCLITIITVEEVAQEQHMVVWAKFQQFILFILLIDAYNFKTDAVLKSPFEFKTVLSKIPFPLHYYTAKCKVINQTGMYCYVLYYGHGEMLFLSSYTSYIVECQWKPTWLDLTWRGFSSWIFKPLVEFPKDNLKHLALISSIDVIWHTWE